MQNKQKERAFFDKFAISQGDYNVFTDKSNIKLMKACIKFSRIKPQTQIVDLGCGTGVFTKILADFRFKASGLDISKNLIEFAKKKYPKIKFIVGDVEDLPLKSNSIDAILLSGIIHHLPDPSTCAREVFRVLKPGGVFVAFDPNRRNPFMWLYRHRSSPFYSNKGVTENERPILAEKTARIFSKAGFKVSVKYLSGLEYRHIASPIVRKILPIYNIIDKAIFQFGFLKQYGAFVITKGIKETKKKK